MIERPQNQTPKSNLKSLTSDFYEQRYETFLDIWRPSWIYAN